MRINIPLVDIDDGTRPTLRSERLNRATPNLIVTTDNQNAQTSIGREKRVFRDEIDVDCFAGGGGASTGIEAATGEPVRVAINHDAKSIAVHRANHPKTTHYINDIWSVKPADVVARHGPVRLVWLSPDCTWFSRAKGSAPIRDAQGHRSRDLAWIAVEWARKAKPRIIMLENVEEFCGWSPLDIDGRPCAQRKGETFALWLAALRHAGYEIEWRYLRACDYGAPTIRKRLFLIARRDGMPIVWPEPTHGPGLTPYRTAAACIEWGVAGHSIFLTREEARKAGCNRPLAEETMRRCARGVYRYVIDADKPFIAPPIAGKTREQNTGEQAGTLALPYFVSGDKENETREARTRSADHPNTTSAPTTNGRNDVIAWLAQHNTGLTGHDAREPLSTIVGKGCTQALMTAQIARAMDRGDARGRDKSMAFNDGWRQRQRQVRTLLEKHRAARPRKEGGMKRSGSSSDLSVVKVHGDDYDIEDVTMRMLTPRELYTAQGFPESYVIDPLYKGKPLSKRVQVKHCGNSVCPQIPEALVRANLAHESGDVSRHRLAYGRSSA